MKTLPRSIALAAATASLVVADAAHSARTLAQDWPNRPMTMVAPFAAGGSTDAIARIVADGLSSQLHQPVIVENIAGAGGMTGANRVAKAVPDGYQFVLGNVGTHAQNQSLYKKPLYDAVTDFAPVALITDQSLVLVARNDFPANNLQEFIAYAKANQGKMQYGSAGVGSGSHLACAQLNSAMGVDITHVPYRGSPPAMQDLIAGRIDYFCALAAAGKTQIESKTMKAIAILTRDRSPILPNLPSAHEQGLVDFDSYFWSGFFLPKGTPAPVVQKLHDATIATMNTPAVQERLKEVGVTVVAADRRSADYLQKFVASETEKWAATIRASGVSID